MMNYRIKPLDKLREASLRNNDLSDYNRTYLLFKDKVLVAELNLEDYNDQDILGFYSPENESYVLYKWMVEPDILSFKDRHNRNLMEYMR